MKSGIFRKTAAFFLALSVLMSLLLPVLATDAELTDTVEEQVLAYAESIKKPNSDEAGAWMFARHGITEQGAMMVADSAHPVTALLMNGELTKAALTELLTEMVSAAQRNDADQVYANGSVIWSNEKLGYGYQVYLGDGPDGTSVSDVACEAFTGETTGYDTMLKWLTGETPMEVRLEKKEVRDKTIAYDVHVRFSNHFVFDPSMDTSHISLALLALFLAGTFVDYDWEASTVFELEIPHSCTHQVPNYRWTYDPQQDAMVNDTSDGCVANEARQIVTESGSRYYELERDVVLRHCDPWVMAYSVKNPNSFAFSLSESKDDESPYFLNYSRLYLFFACKTEDGADTVYYGTTLIGAFRYNATDTYTIRMENVVADDGSNMVWVTVYNETTETVVLEPTPMDDQYMIENGFWVRKSAESDGLSGMDFTIRYIGSASYPLAAETFSLSVLTMGEGEDGGSWFTSTVIDPTCEAQGYTAHTCAMCGYTFADSWVDATGHSWGPWEIVKEATETEAGLQTHTCVTCGKTEEEEIPRLGILYGDANADGAVNSLDVILLRQYLADWVVTVDLAAADSNGDGTVNSLDVILLRQYLADWDVTLGP